MESEIKPDKIIIGRKDILDFPKLDLYGIEVKVDTGAYTSSFHCHHIQEIEKDGVKMLNCKFLDPAHPNYNNKDFWFDNYRIRKVKSSNGIVEVRFSITTEVRIFEQILPIELTLTERGEMKYSILIGRKFLKKKYVVDTAFSNRSHKGKIKFIK